MTRRTRSTESTYQLQNNSSTTYISLYNRSFTCAITYVFIYIYIYIYIYINIHIYITYIYIYIYVYIYVCIYIYIKLLLSKLFNQQNLWKTCQIGQLLYRNVKKEKIKNLFFDELFTRNYFFIVMLVWFLFRSFVRFSF